MKTKNNGWLYNPLLYYGVGLVPAILVCTDLKSAVLFGVLLLLSLILSNFLVSLFRTMIPRQIRIPCFVLISFSSVYLVDALVYLCYPAGYPALTPIIAMIIVSTLLMFRAEEGGYKTYKMKDSFLDAFSYGTSYLISVALLGFIREFFAHGTVWGKQTAFVGVAPGLDSVIGALLIVVFISFLYNSITLPIRRRKNTFDSLVDRYAEYLKQSVCEESASNNCTSSGEELK